jgi:hypothetical protein
MAISPLTDKGREAAANLGATGEALAKLGSSSILGEPSNGPKTDYASKGFIGSDTAGGAFVGYRNPRRQKKEPGGSGAGSAEFAAIDPRRLDLNNGPIRDLADVPAGAEPAVDEGTTQVTVTPMNQTSDPAANDLRVRIRVPSDYLTPLTIGSWLTELQGFGGVIFPYTPQITLEHKADYGSATPLHSNYAINFYKTSSIPDITITGKFTVQNDQDAMVYLATSHVLSALTKMRFGPDEDAGAPPPVCRLEGYGAFMLKNVPVAITSFKHDLPDDVDFYTFDKRGDSGSPFGTTSVPVRSTFTIVCKVMYSRQEMLSASVTKYLNDPSFKGQGFL